MTDEVIEQLTAIAEQLQRLNEAMNWFNLLQSERIGLTQSCEPDSD